ncbi:hypothetical protein PCCS19_06330 [Paenibacillus sp. CCS19]|nr:hypothetical protein PCCS19_06330 [Paenibacillus cellulosilyticus]
MRKKTLIKLTNIDVKDSASIDDYSKTSLRHIGVSLYVVNPILNSIQLVIEPIYK